MRWCGPQERVSGLSVHAQVWCYASATPQGRPTQCCLWWPPEVASVASAVSQQARPSGPSTSCTPLACPSSAGTLTAPAQPLSGRMARPAGQELSLHGVGDHGQLGGGQVLQELIQTLGAATLVEGHSIMDPSQAGCGQSGDQEQQCGDELPSRRADPPPAGKQSWSMGDIETHRTSLFFANCEIGRLSRETPINEPARGRGRCFLRFPV